MRYPENLNEQGTIGFVAPSFGAVIEPYATRFESAKRKFIKMGYKVVEGPNCSLEKGVGKSNTPKNCAEEINDFFINDKSDIIISVGGGETMCEDLSYIDFEGLKNAKPKWYVGYSDNTNLTFLLATLLDTASIYGPCAGDFGMEPWHKSIKDCYELITGKVKEFHNYDGYEVGDWPEEMPFTAPYYITESYSQIIKGGEEVYIKGRIIGGCLDCLVTLCGTGFDKVKEFSDKYKDDGIIWFLEACDLSPMGVRRALWQLKEAGWFENAAGFVIGRPRLNEETFGTTNVNEFMEFVNSFDIPAVLNVDIGHLSPMIPVVTGAIAEVRAENNTFNINYRYE